MTAFTHSEGKVLTYTNECLETISLQFNPSNTYYTSGGNYIIFIKTGSNKILLLDYTYHINRNIFQNYTIHRLQKQFTCVIVICIRHTSTNFVTLHLISAV